ncbi:efflux transporter outer membrane subunit [Rhodoferax aquaticus]
MTHTTTSHHAPAWGRMALSATALLVLSACANFSGISSSAKLIEPKAVGLAPQASQASADLPPLAAPLDAQWWLAYQDSQLNTLITQALDSHPSLRVAQARLARAQAVSQHAESNGAPQVNGSLDMTHQRFTATGMYPPPLAGSVNDTGTLQANASWELDFFGKNRSALDTALGQARAAQADAQAARMLLASNVARTYFALQRVNAQLAVAERTLAQRTQSKALVQDRVNAGLDTQLELQQSDSALPEARFQIEVLKEQQALQLNMLAALTSQQNVPLAPTLTAQAAIEPIALSQTIPLDLLGRRADIAAARWRVEAASSDVANAKTLFYPNVNLVGFAGLSSIGFDKLLKNESQQWGVGPAIRLPIFEAGRLRANLKGKAADLDAAIESYNALVIDAVRDVADQLASAKAIQRQRVEQAAAQASAEAAYAIATQRYKAGLGTYLNVLSAETAVLAQRRQAVDLNARVLDTQIQLIRALGGGYSAEADSLHAAR